MAHAAESTHFYTRKGEPAYTVTAKAGHQRPTTVADARKLGLVPSVTTIIRCAAAPGLERWKLDQMLHAALTLPRGPTEPEAEWISRVWKDSKETARKAAARGTAIHAAIQGHYMGEPPSVELLEHVKAAYKAVHEFTADAPGFRYVPEVAFSSPLGFGGKVDLSNRIGNGVVIDFKTKEFSDPESLKTWDEHALQLAAYRNGLGMDNARCAICYVSVTTPGLAKLIEIPEKELKRGWYMFRALLEYWQFKNDYVSAWNDERQSQVA
jgi:hypothetical protein